MRQLPTDSHPPRAAARDEAFGQYVLPHVAMLLRVARSMTTQLSDAEDLAQDVLLRAYLASDRFDGAHPRAWLLTIMRNTHLNRVRVRRPLLLLDPDRHDDAQAGFPGATRLESAEDAALAGTLDSAVAAALDQLPAGFRAVVILVDLNGLSYAEAARVLGIPPGTVMSRLHRARRRIRRYVIAAEAAEVSEGATR